MGNESSLAVLREKVSEQRKRKEAEAAARLEQNPEHREHVRPDEFIKKVRSDPGNLRVICQAAFTLPEIFHLEDLAVAAWKISPERFGMSRWDYPCTNRLKAAIYGTRGLIARGFLERVGPNVLRATPMARSFAA